MTKHTKEHIEKQRTGVQKWHDEIGFSEETKRKISASLKGRTFSEEHLKKLSQSHMGQVAWNKGIKTGRMSDESRLKMKLSRQHDKSSSWKGDEAEYGAIHDWIKRYYGKADKCENTNCKYPKLDSHNKIMIKPKRYEWALIHGKQYTHNRDNFIQLCKSCHTKYDEINKKHKEGLK